MVRWLALTLLVCTSCGPYFHRKDQTVCPESRDLHCLTNEVCAMDSARGCRVCTCADPSAPSDSNVDQPALPPGD